MNSTKTHATETVTYTEGTFNGSNALKLFYRSWYPVSVDVAINNTDAALASYTDAEVGIGKVKGVLALIHGLGEHSGRYCAVVRALTAAGYAIYAFDNQGHGRSEGQRGHINRWQDYRDNTNAFLQLVRQQEPTAPLFLMGHSLGGLIVLDYVLRSAQSPQFQSFEIKGILVSAPPMQPVGNATHSVRAVVARLLSGLFPRFTLNMGLDQGCLSRDDTVIEQAEEDPLVHPYVTLRWGSETIATIDWVKAHMSQLSLPILLIHGGADPIIDPAGSQAVFQQIKLPEKTLCIYPDSYHEPHNDLDADRVTADMVSWLDDRLSDL
ncbi:MAG: lysophospholipase [Phormidesmis sp.]